MNLPPPESALIEVCQVRKRYAARQILDGIDLSVAGGESLALIGPSGGGKSTLLRCVNGLTSFDSGSVRVGAHRLEGGRFAPSSAAATRQLRRMVGMVFQDYQLFPHCTAQENVAAGPRWVLGWKKEPAMDRARQLLDRVGLGNRLNDYPAQLSGGQRQRVAIARALALEPRAMLCDEVTSALDPELKQEVIAVLADLRTEGLALLMVTHEMEMCRRMADRIVVLADGSIVEEGPPEQVFDAPQHQRTRKFLAEALTG